MVLLQCAYRLTRVEARQGQIDYSRDAPPVQLCTVEWQVSRESNGTEHTATGERWTSDRYR